MVLVHIPNVHMCRFGACKYWVVTYDIGTYTKLLGHVPNLYIFGICLKPFLHIVTILGYVRGLVHIPNAENIWDMKKTLGHVAIIGIC